MWTSFHTAIVCYVSSEYMDVSHLSFIVLFTYWSQLWLECPLVFFPWSFSTGSLILDTKPCHCPLWLYCWRTMRWDLLLMLRAHLTCRHLTLLPYSFDNLSQPAAHSELVYSRTFNWCFVDIVFYKPPNHCALSSNLHFMSKTRFLYLQTTQCVQKHWLERIWNTVLVQSWDIGPLVKYKCWHLK